MDSIMTPTYTMVSMYRGRSLNILFQYMKEKIRKIMAKFSLVKNPLTVTNISTVLEFLQILPDL